MTEVEKKILVTGGAGFIGSHLVDRLVAEGYFVRIIDDLSSGKIENIQHHLHTNRVDFVKGDIRDVSLVRKNVAGIDFVVHLAAIISVPFSVENPELTFDVNLHGTLNLLRSCAEEGVGKFVFISSCAVYGDPEVNPVTEDIKTNPISPYADSKLIGERYCLSFYERQLLKTVVLRFFNVYGSRQGVNDYSGVITRFISRVKKKEPLIIYGDGSQTRDFVNVNDIVDAILAAMKSEKAEGEVFNIGSGKSTSINELAKSVLELSNVDVEIKYENHRAGDIKHSLADISKARKLLDYEPKVSLKDGLRELI
ncbi:MAG: SDR family NAD(P)-dependent oxidoreductase [Candidatus Bathyarchaeota archaeon]|nr:SDR family NAD(P)-dependent oxidoreductase [Candidatus Bathyarchaeota archaeon]